MLLVRVEDGREAVLRQLVDEPWRTHAEPLLHPRARRPRAARGHRGADPEHARAGRAGGPHGRRPQPADDPAPRCRRPGRPGTSTRWPPPCSTSTPSVRDRVRGRATTSRGRSRPSGSCRRGRATTGSTARPSRGSATRSDVRADVPAPRLPSRQRALGGRQGQRGRRLGRDVDRPADLDVAHCASNLAGLHGVEAALAFRRSYVDQGGRLTADADASAYWQLLDLVGFLPAPNGRESGAPAAVLSDGVGSTRPGRPDAGAGARAAARTAPRRDPRPQLGVEVLLDQGGDRVERGLVVAGDLDLVAAARRRGS